MKIVVLCVLIFSQTLWAAEDSKKISATEFFAKEAKMKDRSYSFNPYETIFSGTLAFLIGNVGFYTSKSSILKLGYSGVQTIGVINIGKGLYNINSPSTEQELATTLSNNQDKLVSKEFLSQKLIEIYAKENRAKRIALFYGSSLLSGQYFLNAFVGDTPKELKNIYVFMGGINLLIAGYALNSKSNYEKYYFGDSFDIRPTTYYQAPGKKLEKKLGERFVFAPGLKLTLSF